MDHILDLLARLDLGAAFSSVGLLLDIAGVLLLSRGLLVSEDEAIEMSGGFMGSLNRAEELESPPVRHRLIDAARARLGLSLCGIGFGLQIVGAWA